MEETLLFTSVYEIQNGLDRIQSAFPTVKLVQRPRGDSSGFPVGIDLGLIDQRTWCEWAVDNQMFGNCMDLVILSLDQPEWMRLIFEAHRMKLEADALIENHKKAPKKV